MEDNQRWRSRGLPVHAFEGRLEALARRGVLKLTAPERADVVAIVDEGERRDADGAQIASLLVAWFTRREAERGIEAEKAVRRGEAYVDYLLDLTAEGEIPAFGKLSATLGQLGGPGGNRSGHSA